MGTNVLELTAKEVAARLGISRRWVAKLIERGELRARKAGDYPNAPYLVSLPSVVAYEKKQGKPAK